MIIYDSADYKRYKKNNKNSNYNDDSYLETWEHQNNNNNNNNKFLCSLHS